VGGFEDHEGDVHLSPAVLPLVAELVEDFGDVMVAVVNDNVVVGPLEFFIGSQDGVIPLLRRELVVVEHKVLERTAEGQLSTVHGTHPHEVIDGAIRLADARVSDAGQAAGDAGKSRPDDAVRITMLGDINLHLNFKLRIHQYFINRIDDKFNNIFLQSIKSRRLIAYLSLNVY
jgi:hypothetical protein